MNSFWNLRFAALGAALTATPALVWAENWAPVETNYYNLVDLDSIHREPAGIVYYTWKYGIPEMASDGPHATAVDCSDKLSYPDIVDPDWRSKGRPRSLNTVVGRRLDFVCKANGYPGFHWPANAGK
jgi:hypothetical protein